MTKNENEKPLAARLGHPSAPSTPEPRGAGEWTDIVFDGLPGPDCGRLVALENASRASVRLGEWIERDDGYWCLRIAASPEQIAAAPRLAAEVEALREAEKQARLDAVKIHDDMEALRAERDKAVKDAEDRRRIANNVGKSSGGKDRDLDALRARTAALAGALEGLEGRCRMLMEGQDSIAISGDGGYSDADLRSAFEHGRRAALLTACDVIASKAEDARQALRDHGGRP